MEKCCFCNKEVDETTGNFLCGQWSHKECDIAWFAKLKVGKQLHSNPIDAKGE